MKKIFFLFLLSVCLNSVHAQMWCPTGAEWSYSYYDNYPSQNGYLVLKYTNDSVINSKTYHKINSTFYGYNVAYGSGTVTLSQGYYLLHQNSKLISLYNGYTPDDTLFNFNANIGDKWLRVRYFNNSFCDAQRQVVTVLDTGSVVINTIKLNKLVLSYVRGTWVGGPTTSYTDTVYEKIGSVKNHLIPWTCETATMAIHASGSHPIGTFRCYKDNVFPSYQHAGAPSCYTISSTNISELRKKNLATAFPNPTSSVLHLKSEQNKFDNSEIEIINTLGQTVLKLTYKNEIDVSNLPKGCYFLRVKNSDAEKFHSKFIKE